MKMNHMAQRLFGLIMILTVVLAACAPAEAPAVEATPDATVAPLEEATVEGVTEDETGGEDEIESASSEVASPDAGGLPTREPLPPTWTPAAPPAVPSPTCCAPGVQVTLSGPTATTRPQATRPPECADFAVDETQFVEQFVTGESATLYWQPIRNVVDYRVRLYDVDGEEIMWDWAGQDAASYTISAGMLTFEAAPGEFVFFGWEVEPINAQGNPHCPKLVGELFPVEPTPVPAGQAE